MVQLLPLFAPDALRAGAGPSSRLILAILAGVLTAGECAAGSLTVATWNVENYLSAGRRVDGAFRPGYPKPESEKSALREALKLADADLIALQEMGDEAHLAEFRRDLARDGLDYPFWTWLAAADPDRHVAVLSRQPFTRVAKHDRVEIRYFGETTTVKRGVLEVSVGEGEEEVTLFVVHLKSRYTDRPDDPGSAILRAAEAVAVRDLVLERFPDPAVSRFMIAGDFNDSRDRRPLRAMTRRGEREIARILPAPDDRGDLWTHRFRGNDGHSRVDFILVSPGLLSWATRFEMRTLDTPGVRAASDHRPIVFTFAWE